MPANDYSRWNDRYKSCPEDWFISARSFLVENQSFVPSSGLALDLAMGSGMNAGFLIKRGLIVLGIDISYVAVKMAKKKFPEIQAVVADLTKFFLPSKKFDLILNFYYLQRDLIRDFQRMLKPGGIVFLETLTTGMKESKPEINQEYLLTPGELKQFFSGWEILLYREGRIKSDHNTEKEIASIIARLP